MAELTRREQQILDRLLKGAVPKEIASDLNIANDTVLFHQKNIYRKLEVHSIHELIAKQRAAFSDTAAGAAPLEQAAKTGVNHAKKLPLLNRRILIAAGTFVIVLLFVLFFIVTQTNESVVSGEEKEVQLAEAFTMNERVLSNKKDSIGSPSSAAREAYASNESQHEEPAAQIRNIDFSWRAFKDTLGGTSVSNDIILFNDVVEGELVTSYNLYGFLSSKPFAYAHITGTPAPSTLEAMKAMTSFSFKILGDGKPYMVQIATTDTLAADYDNYLKKFSTRKDKVTTITVKVKDLAQLGFGASVPFIKKNIVYFQLYPLNPGQFNLKVWDIRFF